MADFLLATYLHHKGQDNILNASHAFSVMTPSTYMSPYLLALRP